MISGLINKFITLSLLQMFQLNDTLTNVAAMNVSTHSLILFHVCALKTQLPQWLARFWYARFCFYHRDTLLNRAVSNSIRTVRSHIMQKHKAYGFSLRKVNWIHHSINTDTLMNFLIEYDVVSKPNEMPCYHSYSCSVILDCMIAQQTAQQLCWSKKMA